MVWELDGFLTAEWIEGGCSFLWPAGGADKAADRIRKVYVQAIRRAGEYRQSGGLPSRSVVLRKG